MVPVIKCESGFVHYKKDGTVLRGYVDNRDGGVAQINEGYHPGVDVEDFWENLRYARELYDREGTRPWVCSRKVPS